MLMGILFTVFFFCRSKAKLVSMQDFIVTESKTLGTGAHCKQILKVFHFEFSRLSSAKVELAGSTS